MEINRRRVFLETRLRNLNKVYSKMINHPDLVDETLNIQNEIKHVEMELENL